MKMIVKIKDGKLELPKCIQEKLQIQQDDEIILVEEQDRVILRKKIIPEMQNLTDASRLDPSTTDFPLDEAMIRTLENNYRKFESDHPNWAKHQKKFQEHPELIEEAIIQTWSDGIEE